MRLGATLVLLTAALAAAQQDPPSASRAASPYGGTSARRTIPPDEAARIVERFGDAAPRPLAGLRGRAFADAWSEWVAARSTDLRERLARGDEDTLVNLWLFGTSFTTLPPARPADLAAAGVGEETAAETIEGRLDALIAFLASSADPRARFGRSVMGPHDIDLASPDGRRRARTILERARRRILVENRATELTLEGSRTTGGVAAEAAAHATIFERRGLSTDTSILPAFAIDGALEALERAGAIHAGGVRRVAIVGPGLDVINKAAGHDLYPPETIQPFAVADTLLRLGLASPGALELTTFDVSDRVNTHLADAVARAHRGEGYRVHLTLPRTEAWTGGLVRYWEGWGAEVGAPAGMAPPPASVRARAVLLRPSVVAAVQPVPLDIVLERLELPFDARFDLVVATNVFVYYDVFEQALAVANVGSMLQPGGSLLSNTPLPVDAPIRPEVGQLEVVYSDRQFDRVFWYRTRGASSDGGARRGR